MEFLKNAVDFTRRKVLGDEFSKIMDSISPKPRTADPKTNRSKAKSAAKTKLQTRSAKGGFTAEEIKARRSAKPTPKPAPKSTTVKSGPAKGLPIRSAKGGGLAGASKASPISIPGGRLLGSAGLIYSGVQTTRDLGDSLQRGEGFAAWPGAISNFLQGPKADINSLGSPYDPSTAGKPQPKPNTPDTFFVDGVGLFDSKTQKLIRKADGRLDSPIAGKGPKDNEVGSDADPAEPGLQGPGDPPGLPTQKPSRGASAPTDPNNTGAKGTQMTYQSFMRDIGDPLEIAGKPAMDSANLPGTPGYSESFGVDGVQPGGIQARADVAGSLTGGVGPIKDAKSYAALVDGRVVPKITINAQTLGDVERAAENARQLTPGNPQSEGESRIAAATSGVKRGDFSGIELSEEEQALVSPVQRSTGSRAFLDYDGPGGSLGALRAKEHALGIIKQGGQAFGFDSSLAPADRKLTKMSDDDYRTIMRTGEIMPQSSTVSTPDKPESRVKAKGLATARMAGEAYDPKSPEPAQISQPLPKKGMTHEDIDALPKIQGPGGKMVPDLRSFYQ